MEHERLGATPLRQLAALLDASFEDGPGARLPLLAHWLYFLPKAPQSTLKADGHPPHEDLEIPPQFPRRMWAGSQIRFLAPLCLGDEVTRRRTMLRSEQKTGRSGALLLTTEQYEFSTPAGLAVREYRDIVYRAPAADRPQAPAAASREAPPEDAWEHRRVVRPDALLLFRFSALTFNAHRIHYDRDYCRDVEGYPALVVHGPLTALLLMEHLRPLTGEASVASFDFRIHSSLFDSAPFTLEARREGDRVQARAIDPAGRAAVTGTAVLAPPS